MSWTPGPAMAYKRWYPTATTLADGRVLVLGGSNMNTLDYNEYPEVYDPVSNSWTTLTGARMAVPSYSFVYQNLDGRVVVAGSDEAKMATYALDVAAQTWTVIDPAVLDAGSGVMYAPGKIMKAGSSYLSAPADNGGNVPSSATTYVLDTTQQAPAWQQTASMAQARTHLNLTLLADGTVLATGGSRDIGGLTPSRAVLPAELWSPATQTWTTMAGMQTPRMYHSTATLLPDGRVLVAGGGRLGTATDYTSAEIYSPAYLFKGARPTVTAAPAVTAYGAEFFVATPDAASIASVALVRNGAVTHANNMNQRFVPLGFRVVSGGLMVTAPADARTAPPGHYMLFAVNGAGVPAVAPIVRLPAPYEDSTAPTAPSDLTATPVSYSSVALAWSAATDNVGVVSYNVHRSATPNFAPSVTTLVGSATGTTFTDTGLPPGTFYYRVTAQDAAGNVSPASNETSATVTGDTTRPTVSITSPASGAIVSGTITVTADASDDVGVAGVRFFLDGNPLGAEDTAAPYSMSWNTFSAPNGSHTISAVARDAAGNTTTSSAVTVTVTNTTLPGLIAAWGFEEASGTIATDASGNGHTGTLMNGPARVAGKYGQGLSFDGVNDLVTVADSAQLDLTTGMTLSAWVKPTTTSGWRTVVLKEASGTMSYGLYSSGDGVRPSGYVRVSGNDYAAIGPSALSTTAWSYLAVTYDATTIRLYVNGTQVASLARTGSMTTSNNPLQIGGNNVWSEWFSGLIDEVRVYNRALTAAELTTDMGTPVGGGSPQRTAEGVSGPVGAQKLTPAELHPIVAEAARRWTSSGLSATQADALSQVVFIITDLNTRGELGEALVGNPVVMIDDDGAGRGWFVDPTPADDSEFSAGAGPNDVRALTGSVTSNYDLLTVVMHELGHMLGLGDLEPSTVPDQLMTATLATGTRRLPSSYPDARADGVSTDGGTVAPGTAPLAPSTDAQPLQLPVATGTFREQYEWMVSLRPTAQGSERPNVAVDFDPPRIDDQLSNSIIGSEPEQVRDRDDALWDWELLRGVWVDGNRDRSR